MPRGNAEMIKVHYQGKDDDFLIFAESVEAVQNWKKDKSVPLVQVVDSFKVFTTQKHGNQGLLDGASRASLENEFGTHKEEDVLKQILEKGNVQEKTNPERSADLNISRGPSVAH